jgi:hypothetical protein
MIFLVTLRCTFSKFAKSLMWMLQIYLILISDDSRLDNKPYWYRLKELVEGPSSDYSLSISDSPSKHSDGSRKASQDHLNKKTPPNRNNNNPQEPEPSPRPTKNRMNAVSLVCVESLDVTNRSLQNVYHFVLFDYCIQHSLWRHWFICMISLAYHQNVINACAWCDLFMCMRFGLFGFH